MTNESAIIAIDARLVSRLIATYLDPRAKADTADLEEDLTAAAGAAEYLLRNELETTAELIRCDDVCPGTTFELGVQFGVEAAVAALSSSPAIARDRVRALFDEVKADVHRRIETARRTPSLKAVSRNGQPRRHAPALSLGGSVLSRTACSGKRTRNRVIMRGVGRVLRK